MIRTSGALYKLNTYHKEEKTTKQTNQQANPHRSQDSCCLWRRWGFTRLVLTEPDKYHPICEQGLQFCLSTLRHCIRINRVENICRSWQINQLNKSTDDQIAAAGLDWEARTFYPHWNGVTGLSRSWSTHHVTKQLNGPRPDASCFLLLLSSWWCCEPA